MRILVCVKQVPATAHVTVDEKTGVLQREGVESKLNPYDLFALETALRLREEAGGTVTATASLLQKSRRLHVWNVDITDDEGRLISTCRITNCISQRNQS